MTASFQNTCRIPFSTSTVRNIGLEANLVCVLLAQLHIQHLESYKLFEIMYPVEMDKAGVALQNSELHLQATY